MSLFFAHANPMLTALSDLVLKVVKNTENNLVVAGNVTEMLGVMAKARNTRSKDVLVMYLVTFVVTGMPENAGQSVSSVTS